MANQWGKPIPGWSNTQIFTKMTANIGIMQIISQLNHFIIQSNHKNTFGESHDGSSSRLMAKY